MVKKNSKEQWIKFLGTAGARFVMIKQLRSSGGIWIHSCATDILIDPGPGSIVRCANSRPKLDPTKLDAIILTHRHLDHSNDINVMIEAMTEGGFKKRGTVFLPADAIDKDSIILKHLRKFPGKIIKLKAGETYRIGEVKFSVPVKQIHSVETYGLIFNFDKHKVSFISDTKYFKDLIKYYQGDIIIINTVFFEPRERIEHLNIQDVKEIVRGIKPKKAILTHFGMSMVKAKPHELAKQLTDELKTDVVAAYDGMKLELD